MDGWGWLVPFVGFDAIQTAINSGSSGDGDSSSARVCQKSP